MDFPNKKKVIFGGCARNRKCRLHQLDPETISITSVHYFLIEKNTKYFPRASGLWNSADGNFFQKRKLFAKA